MKPIIFEAQVLQSERCTQKRITLPKDICERWDIQPYDVLEVSITKILPKSINRK
jgi:bifunctional DNA-binding transcriptional regulator/antitoxin component of YhaV-PrlF toxin-antitoxin module